MYQFLHVQSSEDWLRACMRAIYSVLLLYAVTTREQLIVFPVNTLAASLVWLLLANVAMPLATYHVEVTRRRVEDALRRQFPVASIDAAHLRVQPPHVMQEYWDAGAKLRARSDLNTLMLTSFAFALMHRRFVGRKVFSSGQLLAHQAPLLLVKLLGCCTPGRGPRVSFLLLLLCLVCQMHIRTIANLNNSLALSGDPAKYSLSSVTLPFAYAFGMTSAAPATASADWVTALLWTVAMILLDGILPILRCRTDNGTRDSFFSAMCSEPAANLHRTSSPGLGVVTRLAAGLLYWYLRGMGELRSVESFLLTRQQARRRTATRRLE